MLSLTLINKLPLKYPVINLSRCKSFETFFKPIRVAYRNSLAYIKAHNIFEMRQLLFARLPKILVQYKYFPRKSTYFYPAPSVLPYLCKLSTPMTTKFNVYRETSLPQNPFGTERPHHAKWGRRGNVAEPSEPCDVTGIDYYSSQSPRIPLYYWPSPLPAVL